jgi:hypothetical protein
MIEVMGCPPGYRAPADPSPEEIAERCAEIQAGWSEAERLRRLVYHAPVLEAPVVVVADLVRSA